MTPQANRERDGQRSQKQKDNLAYHQRHVERYQHTQDEVRDEFNELHGDGDGSLPDLTQVDAMIERKELEYSIERKTNLDVTNTVAGPNQRKWEKDELEIVDRTIERLPRDYLDRPDGLHEITRTTHPRETVAGHHAGHRISITDAGVDPEGKVGHATEKREGTSADFNAKHGDTIGNLESTLTHEIGHDVADRNPAAFEAFKVAAGYRTYDRDDLTADDMTSDAIEPLDRARKNGTTNSNPGEQRSYTPQRGTDQYWGVDHTALPYSGKEKKNEKDEKDKKGLRADNWEYARHSPDEHFAEVYQKAVHAPKQLHEDMVERPAAEAKAARAEVSAVLTAMSDIPNTPANAGRLAQLQKELEQTRATMEVKQRAVEQRGGQFSVMRNDVFHTDKAAESARSRLGFTLDTNRLAAFDKEAAALSTPEQIKVLEERYRQ